MGLECRPPVLSVGSLSPRGAGWSVSTSHLVAQPPASPADRLSLGVVLPEVAGALAGAWSGSRLPTCTQMPRGRGGREHFGGGCQRGSPEHSAGSLSGSPRPGRAEALISSSREAHGRPGARRPCRAAALPLPLAGGAGHVCHQFAPLLPLHWRLAGREACVGVRPVSCRWLPGGSRRARSVTCRVLSHLRL